MDKKQTSAPESKTFADEINLAAAFQEPSEKKDTPPHLMPNVDVAQQSLSLSAMQAAFHEEERIENAKKNAERLLKPSMP